jgi:hypothetical protein
VSRWQDEVNQAVIEAARDGEICDLTGRPDDRDLAQACPAGGGRRGPAAGCVGPQAPAWTDIARVASPLGISTEVPCVRVVRPWPGTSGVESGTNEFRCALEDRREKASAHGPPAQTSAITMIELTATRLRTKV